MNIIFVKWLRRMQSNYWFLPAFMMLLASGLATAMWWLDYYLQGSEISLIPAVYETDASGAQAILTTVAGSAISVASLVFSITVVVLSLAANQMGPRLLQNFMKHNRTQVVFGAFSGTFVYCLLILATISGQSDAEIPHTAVMLGLALGIVSFVLLIYFIHHVLVFIQISRVLEEVSDEVVTTFDRILLSGDDKQGSGKYSGDSQQYLPDRPPEHSLTAAKSGYLQLIDLDQLVKIATEFEALLHLQSRPGKFLVKQQPLINVWADSELPEECFNKMLNCVQLGAHRTNIQDAEFAIDQLVEVAIRALSPGINDSFTAINCIDRLASGLSEVASKRLPNPYYLDDEDNLRVVAELYSYRSILNAAFDPIRQNARDNVAVTERLMETVRTISQLSISDAYRQALMEHAKLIYAEAKQYTKNKRDFERFEQRYAEFVEQ